MVLKKVLKFSDVCVLVASAALSRTSDLLGLNSDQLAEVLTHRSMILRGEEISTPLTVEQVRVNTKLHRTCWIGSILTVSLHKEWQTCPEALQTADLCSSTGGGLQRLHGHGTLFSVFQLDHPQAQQPHQGQRRLQVHQHPGHLWV